MTAGQFDPLNADSATWLLRWARGRFVGGSDLSPESPPDSLRSSAPSTVVLTVYDRKGGLTVAGQGSGVLDAVKSAVAEALMSAQSAQRLQIDIVLGEPTPLAKPRSDGTLPDRSSREAWQRVITFQDGLIVRRDGQAHWLTPTLLVLLGMDRRDRATESPTVIDVLGAAMARLGLSRSAWTDRSVTLSRVQTSAWIEHASHDLALPLVQGTIPVQQLDRDRLIASAIAGGEYLIRVQRDNGSFAYTLDPWSVPPSSSAYNMLRHAGATSALFEVGQATGDERFVAAGARAADYLATTYHPGTEDGLLYVLDRDGKGKLGGLGLALLALSWKLEHAPKPPDRDYALGLGGQILAMQHENGSFESYLRIRGDEPTGSTSLYYPGEAILGLARIARMGLDEGFQAAAHRGAEYLIKSRAGRDQLPPDAWLMQALEALYAYDPRPAYVEHAVAIARSMLGDQHETDAPTAYAGGFRPDPVRSTRTSARVEGLVAACRLALAVGDPRGPGILAATMRTAPHLLAMQYDADNSFFLSEPEMVLGGMRGGLDDAEIRIDYVQHHITAMLGLAGLIDG